MMYRRLIITRSARRLLCDKASGSNGKARDKRNAAILVTLVSLGVGGAVVYKIAADMHQKIGLGSGVHELERGRTTFIYLDDEESEEDDPTQLKKKKSLRWSRLKKPLFPFLQSRSHDPLTLLKLAHSDDRSVRLLGVKALASQKYWHDSDYLKIAQACNIKTLIGLARSETADTRYFLPPPRLPSTAEVMEDQLRKLLSALPIEDVDKCTRYFTSSALAEGKTPAEERGGLWCFGGNGLAFAESLSPVPEETVELFCLQSMIRHTRVLNHCPHIVKQGGLVLLQRIYQNRKNSINVVRNIARILANLALCEQLHGSIVQGGWVTILQQWMKSPDLAVSLLATKALANLDQDFGERRKYEDGVYLYHPQYRYSEPVYADIVFVHGLLGGPFRTWRQKDPIKPPKNKKNGNSNKSNEELNSSMSKSEQKDSTGASQSITNNDSDQSKVDNQSQEEQLWAENTIESEDLELSEFDQSLCWPKDWLAQDCPHVRIVTVEYETHLSEWAPKCPYESEKRLLSTRSTEMLAKLKKAGIGDRPVIWVGHSMGGLLIKKMLVQAQSDPVMSRMVKHTKGIVLYSVPHQGSPLAAYGRQTKYLLYPSVEVKELSQGSEKLLELHEKFRELMFHHGIPLLSFGEGKKSDLPFNMKTLIVPKESSDPGFGEYHLMDDLNHLDICKPASPNSPLYCMTKEFIKDCLPLHLVEHILGSATNEEFVLPNMQS